MVSPIKSDAAEGHSSLSDVACKTSQAALSALSHKLRVVSSVRKRLSKLLSRIKHRGRQTQDQAHGQLGGSVSFPMTAQSCGKLNAVSGNAEFSRYSTLIHGSSDSLLPVLGATPPNGYSPPSGCSPPGGHSPTYISSLFPPQPAYQQQQFVQSGESPFKTYSTTFQRSSGLPSPVGCEIGAASHSVGHLLLSCLSGDTSENIPSDHRPAPKQQQQQHQQQQRSWSHLFARTKSGQPQHHPSPPPASSPIGDKLRKLSPIEVNPSYASHDNLIVPRPYQAVGSGQDTARSPHPVPGGSAGHTTRCLSSESPAAATCALWNRSTLSVRQMQANRPSAARLLAYRAPEVLAVAEGAAAARPPTPQPDVGAGLRDDEDGGIDSGRNSGGDKQQLGAAAVHSKGPSAAETTLCDAEPGAATNPLAAAAAAAAAAAPVKVSCTVRQGPTPVAKGSLSSTPFGPDTLESLQSKPPAAEGSDCCKGGPSSPCSMAASTRPSALSSALSAKASTCTTTAFACAATAASTSARGGSPVVVMGSPCGRCDTPYDSHVVAESAAPASDHVLALSPSLPSAMRRACWSLDDYKIIRRLYKGSSSAVYKAICARSGTPVALKVYFLKKVPQAVLHMICREIEIHSSAVHPNIIVLYAAFMSDKHLTLVMEYAVRGDLLGLQDTMTSRRMDERTAAKVVLRPLMDAVLYLHRQGVCHRDIKPENVLFTSDWQLKLADFGVSINLAKERAVTRAGTECYMAPEVARCPLKVRPEDNKHNRDLSYGTACDIWAVGVLAYELLVGFTPLRSGLQPEQERPAAEARRPVLTFPGGTTDIPRDFIARCLADGPEDRPSSLELSRHPWLLAGRKAATPQSSAGSTLQQAVRPK